MMSTDIIEEFIAKLKKEKIQYFIYLSKNPGKKQKIKNPDVDMTIAHYQNLSGKNLLILSYCLSKMIATGNFDPNQPWDGLDSEDDDGESWKVDL